MLRDRSSSRPRARRSPQRFLSARLFALFVAAFAVPGCATLGMGGVNLISVEEEWEMGRQFEAELAQELDVREDASLTRMGERIVSQTDKAELPWRFYVVEDESVNAFNVPGGLVYVHSGLIEAAGNEDELAAVVGHEIGHGVARHGTERLSQQYGLSVLAGVVLGEDPGIVSEIVAQVVAAGAVAQFSREQEFEADELGVRHMAAAGYDPQGMVNFLERLVEMAQRDPGTVERFFATHPATEERIEAVEGQIEEIRAQDR